MASVPLHVSDPGHVPASHRERARSGSISSIRQAAAAGDRPRLLSVKSLKDPCFKCYVRPLVNWTTAGCSHLSSPLWKNKRCYECLSEADKFFWSPTHVLRDGWRVLFIQLCVTVQRKSGWPFTHKRSLTFTTLCIE